MNYINNGFKKHRVISILIILLTVLLAVSIYFNINNYFEQYIIYLQRPDEIYIMEAGILKNNLLFADGDDYTFRYDFENEEYSYLIEEYKIDKIAGDGSEFEKAKNLMNEFAPRLNHESNYDNSIEMNAEALLDYSLDNQNHGINCRNKAQILNEMCLALGIYARKVWIMPNSGYDQDCHVVNEVWDSTRNKWIMLDITNDQYWVDDAGEPLSILEIRESGANRTFCTPVKGQDSLSDLDKRKEKHLGSFLYIMKNLVYMQYCDTYSLGESDTIYLLFPKNMDTDYSYIISEQSVNASPYSK